MSKEKASLTFKLSLISSILIFLNGVWIAANDKPLVFSTNPSLTTYEAVNSTATFWGRISFGYKGIAEGLWAPFWLIFAVALLGCTIEIYRKPRKHKIFGLLIVLFSILSFPIGGGFFAGLILGFIAGLLALEWPKPFRETFIGKMVRAVKLDSKIVQEVADDPRAMRTGVSALILTSIVMGLGNAIYAFNANLIKTKPVAAEEILILGKVNITTLTLTNAVSFVAIIFSRWLVLSLILYILTVKLKGYSMEFGKLACATSFAFIPLCLQGVLPALFANDPYLSFHWPMVILVISTIWMILAVIALVRNLFEIKMREALGVTIFAGISYWFMDNLLFASNPMISTPGVNITINPASSETILLHGALAILLAALLGAFTTKQSK